MFTWVKAAWNAVFGGSTSGKSVAETVAETVDNYAPGQVTQHKMQVEDVKVGDESQAQARQFEPKASGLSDWWNLFIDGLNRLPRPLFALWAFGELSGLLAVPPGLNTLHPIVLNIIWTIIGFYFGIRTVSQDLPKMLDAYRLMRELNKK